MSFLRGWLRLFSGFVAISVSFSGLAQVTAHVVDAPNGPMEYTSLPAAVEAVCREVSGEETGRVVIATSRPLEVARLELGCPVEIVAEKGVGAHILSPGPALSILSSSSLILRGLVLEAPTAVLVSAEARAEIQANRFMAPARLELHGPGGAKVEDNLAPSLDVEVGAHAARYEIRGNGVLSDAAKDDSFQGSLRLSSAAESGGHFALESNTGFETVELDLRLRLDSELFLKGNVGANATVKLCGREFVGVKTEGERFGKFSYSFGGRELRLEQDLARGADWVLDLVRCAGMDVGVGKAEAILKDLVMDRRFRVSNVAGLPIELAVDLERVRIGRVELDVREASVPGTCLSFEGTAQLVEGSFSVRAECNVALKLRESELKAGLQAELNGKVQEILNADVKAAGNVLYSLGPNTAEVKFDQDKVEVKGQMELHSLGPVSISGTVQGAYFRPDSSMNGFLLITVQETGIKNDGPVSVPGTLVLRDLDFTGVANPAIKLVNVPGAVLIERVKMPLSGFPGSPAGGMGMFGASISLRGVTGPVQIRDALVESSSMMGLLLNVENTRDVTVENSQFINRAAYAAGAVVMVSSPGRFSSLALKDTQVTSEAQGIAISTQADANPALVEVEGGAIKGQFWLIGTSFGLLRNVAFSSGSKIADMREGGGLLEDPASCSGLDPAEDILTPIDFDGNGCVDYPPNANIPDENGECPQGTSVPAKPTG